MILLIRANNGICNHIFINSKKASEFRRFFVEIYGRNICLRPNGHLFKEQIEYSYCDKFIVVCNVKLFK